MSALEFEVLQGRACLGLKGARAAEWLAAHALVLPAAPNSWTCGGGHGGAGEPLVARLGATEFFLEDGAQGRVLEGLAAGLAAGPPGVYPVLREDSAFRLSGEGAHDALAQVCNVQFAALDLERRPVVMTLMIGVAVVVVPQDAAGGRCYRIWCDPTFGPSLSETVGAVILDCGGTIRGVSG